MPTTAQTGGHDHGLSLASSFDAILPMRYTTAATCIATLHASFGDAAMLHGASPVQPRAVVNMKFSNWLFPVKASGTTMADVEEGTSVLATLGVVAPTGADLRRGSRRRHVGMSFPSVRMDQLGSGRR